MISRLDGRLRREIRDYQLRFTCERCVQLDEPSGRCALGYPNEDHRERPLDGDSVVFCKEFELA